MKLKTLEHDAGMSRHACSSAAVYTGKGDTLTYKGLIVPGFDDMTGEIVFKKGNNTEDVMIFFPGMKLLIIFISLLMTAVRFCR